MNLASFASCGRQSAVLASLIVGGCGQFEKWTHPELGACEEYIRTTLKSPSSYKREKVTISDNQLPFEYWHERTLELFAGKISPELKDDMDGVDRRLAFEGGVRNVIVEYDASNGFGVPIREMTLCQFEMQSLAEDRYSSAPSATQAISIRAAAAIGVGKESEIPCCESKRVMDRLAKFQAQEKFVSHQVLN